jgi:hypothetical protein
MGVFSHSGSRVMVRRLEAGPTSAVRNVYASVGGSAESRVETNSSSDDTVVFLKYVGRRDGAAGGDDVAGD